MTIQFWRLSEATDGNLGLACTADGLLLGRTPLVEQRGQHFVVREQREIERLFSRVSRRRRSRANHVRPRHRRGGLECR